jgi:hypothetical protein
MKRINTFLLFVSLMGLVSCAHIEETAVERLESCPITKLLKKNVPLVNGIVFDTGKILGLNPLNGQALAPCDSGEKLLVFQRIANVVRQKIVPNLKPKQTLVDSCKPSQIVDASPEIVRAIQSSSSPIQGTIKSKGVIKPARFIVTVTALHENSNCTTTFTEGQQVTNCLDNEARCEQLESLGLACK